MKFYEELLQSYSKLKQRKLKISLEEAQKPLDPASPALQVEPNVISTLSTIQPNQSVTQAGMVFTRKMNNSGQDALYITGGEDPRGRGTVAPVGYYQGSKFTPKELADGKQLHTRSMWVRILNKFVNSEADPEAQQQAEYQAEMEGMNVPLELDSPRIRQSLMKTKTSLTDMRNRGGLNRVIEAKYDNDKSKAAWYGKSSANIAGYIVSETDPKALNNKLRNSTSYKEIKLINPVTDEVTATLEHSTSVDIEVAEDCLEQFHYSINVMERLSNPDTDRPVSDKELATVASMIELDRKRGLIIRRAANDPEFIFLPNKSASLWEDIIDNHNLLLSDKGKQDYSIKNKSIKSSETGNLNDIRGKGIEKLLEVIGLIQTGNIEGAKDSLTSIFRNYGFALFQAFSTFTNYEEEGAVDGFDLNNAFIAENISEIFGMAYEPREDAIPDQGSGDRDKVQKQTKDALSKILNQTLSLYKDSVQTRRPKAIIHTGDKSQLGDKSDVKEVYDTPGEARDALARSGFSSDVISKLGIVTSKASEQFTPEEIAKFNLDPNKNISTVGLSMKTYCYEGNVNFGESSHKQFLTSIQYENDLVKSHSEAVGIDGRRLADVQQMATEISNGLKSFKYLTDPKYAETAKASIVNFLKDKLGARERITNPVLDAFEGTNGKEAFSPTNKALTNKVVAKLTTQAYRSILKSKLKTKMGRNFIAMKLAMIGGGSEEVMATMKFLDTGNSVNMLQNKAVHDIGKKLVAGEYETDFNPESGSIRIHAKGDKSKTICSLKEHLRDGVTPDDEEESLKTFIPSYQVMISPNYFNKNNLKESYVLDGSSILESLTLSGLIRLVNS